MVNKVLLGALSAIFVLAVTIGAVAVVLRTVHRAGSDFTVPPESDHELVTKSKSIASFCASTDYNDACEQTLKSAVNTSEATPKQVVQTVVKATMSEIEAAVRLAVNISQHVHANDSMNQMALDDCKRLFDDAVQEINAAFLHTHDLRALAKRLIAHKDK
ncbi:hypothetical protein Cni_G02938 [Canna indica]|uniref:Pectinesterase inhibitor domain-containing protein n=1 Tax=Canna indica TaxID=4628 RepID=A0AAQ3JQH1_9LILI|nr:hypothetical protein Cni_G02938 [Canna indica]